MTQYYSLLREKQYDALSLLTMDGKVLDVGGVRNSDYHKLVRGNHIITTINIVDGADVVADVQKEFPFESGSFDHIICLNVLEHIYEFNNTVSEMHRVLKAGGTCAVSTPFMHHIHGCPDDYFRYTESALRKILSDHGFIKVSVHPIGGCVFSLLHQTISGMLPVPVKHIFKYLSYHIDRLLTRLSPRYSRVGLRVPLGYFVTASKGKS